MAVPSTRYLSFVQAFISSAVLISLLAPLGFSATPRHSRRQTLDPNDSPCSGFFPLYYDLFTANDTYACLTSAPFNKTVALGFLQYYSDTLQLQSTDAYLKNPPSDYQQPTFDIVGALDQIKAEVNAGTFANEYDFELALQKLVLGTHDAHISLEYGISSIFTYGSPYGIVSVSTDGIAAPKVFVAEDLIEIASTGATSWTPSAIQSINGEVVTKFLEDFAAANVQGYTEPNADWNNLMASAAYDIQGLYSVFEGGSIFYPGDTIKFVYENGSDSGDLDWLAQFSLFAGAEDAPNITTGQQLYDWYVLGIDSTPPSSTTSSAPTSTATADTTSDNSTSSASPTTDASSTNVGSATPSFWDSIAYPTNPVVAQNDLGGTTGLDGGVVTGYFLNDNVTAVLSLPSFSLNIENDNSFSSTVSDFITQSKQAGCTRVIIDLQRNQGGNDLLATDTFKQFFPAIDPFGGARQRATDIADALGNTFTQYYDTHQFNDNDVPSYEELSASVWTATDYIDAATGANFTSWGEYFGPHPDHGDEFTTVSRDNLSSIIYDEQSAGVVVTGFANHTDNEPLPFPAKDTIILTDGYCSSACARFVEMMHHEAGARTIVVGGRPDTSQMQAVGGNKGALIYDALALDIDIDNAILFNATVNNSLPQGRDDEDFILSYASFNIKDAIRKDSYTPLQFTYEAADCRIYYTHNTIYNYINLWNYVIDAFYRNPSLCIASSTSPDPLVPSTVGSQIMAGLSPNNHRKRSLSLSPRSPLLDTTALDAPVVQSCPSSCQASRGQGCFSNAACNIPARCTVTCNAFKSCPNTGSTICDHSTHLCITRQESQQLQSCGTRVSGGSPKAPARGPNPALQQDTQFSFGSQKAVRNPPKGRH